MDSHLLSENNCLSFFLKPPSFKKKQLDQLKDMAISIGYEPYYYSLLGANPSSLKVGKKSQMPLLILDDIFAYYVFQKEQDLYELLSQYENVWVLDYVFYENKLKSLSFGFSKTFIFKRYWLHTNLLLPSSENGAQILWQRNKKAQNESWCVLTHLSRPIRNYLAFQKPGGFVYACDIDCSFFQKLFSWGRTKWQIYFSFEHI